MSFIKFTLHLSFNFGRTFVVQQIFFHVQKRANMYLPKVLIDFHKLAPQYVSVSLYSSAAISSLSTILTHNYTSYLLVIEKAENKTEIVNK